MDSLHCSLRYIALLAMFVFLSADVEILLALANVRSIRRSNLWPSNATNVSAPTIAPTFSIVRIVDKQLRERIQMLVRQRHEY